MVTKRRLKFTEQSTTIVVEALVESDELTREEIIKETSKLMEEAHGEVSMLKFKYNKQK